MPTFSVFGAGGFIGRHLVAHLRADGHDVWEVPREAVPDDRPLGHAVWCIGLTQDFRQRLLDTAEAHVGALVPVLRRCDLESFTYLSSTRLYRGEGVAFEDDSIAVAPSWASDVYNATKAAGEALVLAVLGARARVARLSNVYGPGQAETFLASVVHDLRTTGRVTMQTSRDSAKDYISVADVVGLLGRIAIDGRSAIYNVASGRNTSNAELAAALEASLGGQVSFLDGAPSVRFPRIAIDRIRTEFGAAPRSVLDDLAALR